MDAIILSMLLAFCGYSALNISQASQKIGLCMMDSHRLKGAVLWGFATIGTVGSNLVVLSAVSLGRVSIVGAMAGTGLASLTFFSRFVMKEHIGLKELSGVALVLAGAVLIGLFSTVPMDPPVRVKTAFILIAAVTAAGILTVIFLRSGVVTGALAGALGGFIPAFQKISTSEIGRTSSLVGRAATGRSAEGILHQAGQIFTNPFSFAWILLSILSMVILQFSFRRDRVIRIIPSFTASLVLIPVLSEIFIFGEPIPLLQWSGIAVILAGVLVITLRRGESSPCP
jgi:drug/metabolite transporter (DMT)-like permease